MRIFPAKYPALLVLLISLLFLTGTYAVATSTNGPEGFALCCEHDPAEQQAPASDGECSDSGCRCPSCQASILDFVEFPNQTPLAVQVSLALLSATTQSDYVRLIDYPPEFI